eukprot:scaffold7092_cov262-Pinguiococcus_pyrenoidosus.AAC.50
MIVCCGGQRQDFCFDSEKLPPRFAPIATGWVQFSLRARQPISRIWSGYCCEAPCDWPLDASRNALIETPITRPLEAAARSLYPAVLRRVGAPRLRPLLRLQTNPHQSHLKQHRLKKTPTPAAVRRRHQCTSRGAFPAPPARLSWLWTRRPTGVAPGELRAGARGEPKCQG